MTFPILGGPYASGDAQDIVSRFFAGVHMLSHVVGTANRADIRRLRQLEADNVLLAANVERQQRQLYEGFVERDRTIRELNEIAVHLG